MTRKTTPALTLAALLLTGFAALTPSPAHAGADGRRNTTIALGAAAVYELLQHKTTNALVLGAGAAYAEKQYENSRKSERDARDDRRYYRPFPGDRNNNGGPYYNGDRSHNSGGSYNNGGGDYEHHTYPFPSDGNRDRRDDNRNDCDDRQGDRNNGRDQHDNRGWDGRSQPPGQQRVRYQPWPGGR